MLSNSVFLWIFHYTSEAKIKNKFVSPYPDRPCQNRQTEIFLLEICRHFFLSRFAENSVFQIRFAKRSIFSHYRAHLCRQKKKPAYLRGNRNIFNCGLTKFVLIIGSFSTPLPFWHLIIEGGEASIHVYHQVWPWFHWKIRILFS